MLLKYNKCSSCHSGNRGRVYLHALSLEVSPKAPQLFCEDEAVSVSACMFLEVTETLPWPAKEMPFKIVHASLCMASWCVKEHSSVSLAEALTSGILFHSS